VGTSVLLVGISVLLVGTSLLNAFTEMQDDVFTPKFGTQICEFVLHSHVKR
jgi:hypothetical protein